MHKIPAFQSSKTMQMRAAGTVFWAFVLVAVLTSPGTSIAQDGPDTSRVIKGSLPSSAEYWKFNEWYRTNNAVLSLIVSGEDRNHLLDSLKALKDLRAKGVLLGSLVVVGGISFPLLNPDQDREPPDKRLTKNLSKLPLEVLQFYRERYGPSELRDTAARLGLGTGENADVAALIQKYKLSSSPAWIVRYRDQDYIFEGKVNIKKYFTEDGQFVAPASNSVFD